MVSVIPAAPIDGPAVLPDALIEQFVKPGDEQTALLDALRLSALDWVERHTSRSMQRRSWVAMFDGFDGVLRLPREPVHAVTALAYVDPAGVASDGAGLWQLAGAHLLPVSGTRWPATPRRAGAVIVTFEAGYDDVEIAAPGLRVAALMLMKHLFDGGSVHDVPATVSMLLDDQYRTPVLR